MGHFNRITFWVVMAPLAIALSLIATFPKLVFAQMLIEQIPPSAIAQRPPEPPSDPPPNDTRPGGGLSPQDSLSCNSLNNSVQALIPVENPVLTTTGSPTFLFYIPFGAEQIQFGEFSLLSWPGEQQRLYQIRFTLPQTPGVVSVTLPPQPEYTLQEGNHYRWYFQLYCQGGTGRQPDLTVNGMVHRVALTSERERQIWDATPDVWYDALAQVAAQLQASPQDAALREKWRSLLQTIEAEDLAQEPLLGSVLPLESTSSH